MNKVVPNLFIVGAPKCGTTALASYLSDHPNVFFSNPKEPFYLATDFPEPPREFGLTCLADYLALFQNADRSRQTVIAEGSTNYLRSEIAVKNALALNPKARFICCLRDPVEIAHAFHMEQVWCQNEQIRNFALAWNLQEERSLDRFISNRCRDPGFLQYRKIASIGDQLARFFSIVPEHQRLIVFLEDLKVRPHEVYRTVLTFVSLRHDGRREFPPVNSAKVHRFSWLAKFTLAPPKSIRGPIDYLRHIQNKYRFPPIELLKRYLRISRPREEIDKSLEAAIRAEFRPQVELIEKLTRRKLDHWK